MHRLELGDGREDRYKKITFWKQGVDELLVSVFIESQEKAPKEIILDVDGRRRSVSLQGSEARKRPKISPVQQSARGNIRPRLTKPPQSCSLAPLCGFPGSLVRNAG